MFNGINTMISINDWVVYIIARRMINSIELAKVVKSISLIYRFKSLVLAASANSSIALEYTKASNSISHVIII